MKTAADWPKVRSRPDGYWVIDCGMVSGRRVQYVRKTEALAKAKAKDLRNERDRVGVTAFNMTAQQRLDAARAFMRLAEAGHQSLETAVDFFLAHRGPAASTMTVTQVYEDLLRRQDENKLAIRSRQTTRNRLSGFVGAFGKRRIAEVTHQDIRSWLDAQAIVNATTKRTLILYLQLLFNHAKREDAIRESPMLKIDKPKVEYALPKWMAVEKVQAIMRAAEEHHQDVVPRLAIGFFAGLRSCELDRLEWESINWDEGIITILHTKTSSGHLQSIPRHVNMSANLRAWLERYKGSGRIGPVGKRLTEARNALAQAVGEPWEENACRHTFATMHMAKHRSADALASELGHLQGVRILFRHYRGLATGSQADTYWSMMPATKGLDQAAVA